MGKTAGTKSEERRARKAEEYSTYLLQEHQPHIEREHQQVQPADQPPPRQHHQQRHEGLQPELRVLRGRSIAQKLFGGMCDITVGSRLKMHKRDTCLVLLMHSTYRSH